MGEEISFELIAQAIVFETSLRASLNDSDDEDTIRKKIIEKCTCFELRDIVEGKVNKGIFSESVYVDLSKLYLYQKTHPHLQTQFAAEPKFPRIEKTEDDYCRWPCCETKSRLEKDHIIPKSSLYDDKKEVGKDWDRNGQWLCAYHNRVKTDGIMVGVVMVQVK